MSYLRVLIGLCFIISQAHADRFYVSAGASEGGDGSSWATAYRHLQDALDQTVANRGDEVWVAAGTYYPDEGETVLDEDRTSSFTVKDAVTVYGGFIGNEATLEERDFGINESILCGEIFAGDENMEFWALHVVTVVGNGTLDGIVVEKGNANGSVAPHNVGGGLYAESETFTLRNCNFRNNRATKEGGAIQLNAASPVLEDCIFSENFAQKGGAIYGGAFSVANCDFINNEASSSGGAIYGRVTATDCLFESNTASAGGAIAVNGPTIKGINSTFRENSAGNGGAIHCSNGNLVAEDCLFQDNTADSGGGAVYGSTQATGSDFLNNTSGTNGGAILGTLNAENCNFEDNTAGAHGGVANSFGISPTLRGCTVINNSAEGVGGAFNCLIGSAENSVFMNNSSDVGGVIHASQFTANNCVFLNNSSKEGGVCYFRPKTSATDSRFYNCLFLSNRAENESDSGVGGAILLEGGSVTFYNCILSDNTMEVALNHVAGSGSVRDYEPLDEPPFPVPDPPGPIHFPNMIEGGISTITASTIDFGPELIDDLPEFVNQNDSVGPDLEWGTEDDGLRPLANGNLIDSGKNEELYIGNEQDLAGFLRIQGEEVDLGAYEFGDQRSAFLLTTSASPEDGGIVLESGDGVYDKDTTALVEAVPSLGYVFIQWVGDASGSIADLSLTMDGDKSITALFSQDESDSDFDGLTAYDELVVYQTDPNKRDTDGDGLKDGDEIGTIFDPNVDDTPSLVVIGAHPEIYLDLVASMGGIHPEIMITKSESGDFVVQLRVEATENLRDWTTLNLTDAIIDGDTITIVIPESESVNFLRILGSKRIPEFQ